jgi:Kef-type K+ transport system membrane component KefB
VLLQKLAFADQAISSIHSWDEAIVIAVALSLSSSAFVLQILGEKGQLASRYARCTALRFSCAFFVCIVAHPVPSACSGTNRSAPGPASRCRSSCQRDVIPGYLTATRPCRRSGSATLGILLLQDLVTVPFLVLLPVLEGTTVTGDGAAVAAAAASAAGALSATTGPVGAAAVAAAAAGFSGLTGVSYDEVQGLIDSAPVGTVAGEFLPAAARSLGLMGAIALFGRFGLRRVFEAVATTGSADAFVATCLVTVLGTSFATELAGFGQTLGAFLAGVLLAETSFRPQARVLATCPFRLFVPAGAAALARALRSSSCRYRSRLSCPGVSCSSRAEPRVATLQVEAEVKPFKGILLGLFFLCTGAAVDVPILLHNFPTIVLLTIGLISVKFAITSIAARGIGLTEAESVKVGLTLSQARSMAVPVIVQHRERQPPAVYMATGKRWHAPRHGDSEVVIIRCKHALPCRAASSRSCYSRSRRSCACCRRT